MTSNTHCGLVAVLGAPNAGKSTLVNALVGQKVAIVSAKAQTTRARLMGIALEGDTQIILADTPGIFAPKRRLDRAMVSAAWEGAQEADAILLVVDARKKRRDDLEPILEALKTRPERKLLVLNKVDACTKEPLLVMAEELSGLVGFDEVFFVSALSGDGVPELKQRLAALMPEGPWHYPEDQVSDASERLLAAEITREQLYRQLLGMIRKRFLGMDLQSSLNVAASNAAAPAMAPVRVLRPGPKSQRRALRPSRFSARGYPVLARMDR